MGGPIFHAFYTLLVFGVIIVIILWAYSRRNKDKFEHDANSIFEDEEMSKKSSRRHKQESDSNE